MSQSILAAAIENFETFDAPALIDLLTTLDDLYHNGEESPATDAQYDAIKRYAERQNPAHAYFTGIGSEVRGGKIKLPYQLGSLNQVYEGEVAEWINKHDLQKEELVVTDKLDGTSAMVVYDQSGNFQIAYSRGNGVEGADISRHIKKIRNIPMKINQPLVVRGEVIISVENFPKAQKAAKSRSGSAYKNPRNMVAGLMNASSNSDDVYVFVDFVAYDILNLQKGKLEQLQTLSQLGFKIPAAIVMKNPSDKELTECVNAFRSQSKYELDGIVIDVNAKHLRKKMNPTSSTLNPAYAVKYKIATADNLKTTRVIGVEWNVSKHKYLKPRVVVEPIELMGVTVQHATGFNAKFIRDNNIGPGALIQITRSGDVIPFIVACLEPGEVDLPDGEWTETGIDLIAIDEQSAAIAHIEQVNDFFASIDAPHLKDGSVLKMMEKGFKTIDQIINADELDFILAFGKNGAKAYEGLMERLQNIYIHDLYGSTSFFGRGVGKRRFKKLFEEIKEADLFAGKVTVAQIIAVDGFEEKTAQKIIDGMPAYREWYGKVKNKVRIIEPKVTGLSMNGQKVVFTGFRDKGLEKEIEANGGQMQTGVSKNTTLVVAADPNSNSGKVKKATDLGIKVIGLEDLKQLL